MLDAFRLSFQLAFCTSLALLLLGVPLSYALARKQFFGKRLLEVLVLLPLTLPPTVLGFYLLLLLGHQGPLKALGINWAFRFEGLLLGSFIFSLPFALSAYREAMRSIDARLLDDAKLNGASRFQCWQHVILPLSWPGLLSGTLLAFAHTLGEFGVILMIGGSIPGKTKLVSIYIYDLVQGLRFSEAGYVAGVLFVFSFLILYLIRYIEERWSLHIAPVSPRP
jgi:molybdate transport system permease protein